MSSSNRRFLLAVVTLEGETTGKRRVEDRVGNRRVFTGVTTARIKDGMGRRRGNDDFIKNGQLVQIDREMTSFRRVLGYSHC